MSSVAQFSAISQAVVQQDVAYAVARKSLDTARAQGDAAIALLQGAAEIQQSVQTQRSLEPGQTLSVVA